MLTKRIIPCLDVRNGRTVKGTQFADLQDAGDPVELGIRYSEQGADELVYLDIAATHEGRSAFAVLVRSVARQLNIPFTVGGGIRTIADIAALLDAGADKVTINSSALSTPSVITEAAAHFGSQMVVVAIDARCIAGQWRVFTHGGSRMTNRELFDWTREAQERGAGEILFTSMDHDGMRKGFALDPLEGLARSLRIPLVASGGAGVPEDFLDLFQKTSVSAALAAGVFHYGNISLSHLKVYLQKEGIAIRQTAKP